MAKRWYINTYIVFGVQSSIFLQDKCNMEWMDYLNPITPFFFVIHTRQRISWTETCCLQNCTKRAVFFPKERPGVRLIECQGKAGVSCLSIAVERVCYLLPNKFGLKAAPTRGMWLFWCCYPIFRMKDKQFPCRPPFPIRIALCTYFKTKLDFPDSEWGFSFNSSLLVDFNKPAPSGRSTFIFVFSHP